LKWAQKSSAVGWGVVCIGYAILGMVWLKTRRKKQDEKQFGSRSIDMVVSSVRISSPEIAAVADATEGL
jgi:hypothetical protein